MAAISPAEIGEVFQQKTAAAVAIVFGVFQHLLGAIDVLLATFFIDLGSQHDFGGLHAASGEGHAGYLLVWHVVDNAQLREVFQHFVDGVQG